jgi:hypothetical protein
MLANERNGLLILSVRLGDPPSPPPVGTAPPSSFLVGHSGRGGDRGRALSWHQIHTTVESRFYYAGLSAFVIPFFDESTYLMKMI